MDPSVISCRHLLVLRYYNSYLVFHFSLLFVTFGKPPPSTFRTQLAVVQTLVFFIFIFIVFSINFFPQGPIRSD